jgi:hypothetical protein
VRAMSQSMTIPASPPPKFDEKKESAVAALLKAERTRPSAASARPGRTSCSFTANPTNAGFTPARPQCAEIVGRDTPNCLASTRVPGQSGSARAALIAVSTLAG